MKEIKNRKLDFRYISWDELKTYEHNDLKDSKNRDVSKLKNNIVNDNFSFPIYVWKRFLLDGDGRVKALNELEKEGYIIPDLPVVEIEAETKQAAKKLVMQASSQYGEITKESYELFIQDIDIEIKDIELNIIDIDMERVEGDDEDIDFDNMKSTQGREKKFSTHTVACPHCSNTFEVQA